MSALDPKEIAFFFRNCVQPYIMVEIMLFCMDLFFAYSIPIVALSPLLQTETLLKNFAWYRGKVGLMFGEGFIPSSHASHPHTL